MSNETRAERRIRLHHQLVRRRRISNALDQLLVAMYGDAAAAEYGYYDRRPDEREHCPCCCLAVSR